MKKKEIVYLKWIDSGMESGWRDRQSLTLPIDSFPDLTWE